MARIGNLMCILCSKLLHQTNNYKTGSEIFSYSNRAAFKFAIEVLPVVYHLRVNINIYILSHLNSFLVNFSAIHYYCPTPLVFILFAEIHCPILFQKLFQPIYNVLIRRYGRDAFIIATYNAQG